jgi:hypothetical protein
VLRARRKCALDAEGVGDGTLRAYVMTAAILAGAGSDES